MIPHHHLGGGTTGGELCAQCGMAGGGMSGFFGNCPGMSMCFGGVPGTLGVLPLLQNRLPSKDSDILLGTEPRHGVLPGFSICAGDEPRLGVLPGFSICAGDITGVLGVLLRLRNISSILLLRVTRSP